MSERYSLDDFANYLSRGLGIPCDLTRLVLKEFLMDARRMVENGYYLDFVGLFSLGRPGGVVCTVGYITDMVARRLGYSSEVVDRVVREYLDAVGRVVVEGTSVNVYRLGTLFAGRGVSGGVWGRVSESLGRDYGVRISVSPALRERCKGREK